MLSGAQISPRHKAINVYVVVVCFDPSCGLEHSEDVIDILAHTLADLLYGEMLCWDMSGGEYSLAKRTDEFCNYFLESIMAPYLIKEEAKQ